MNKKVESFGPSELLWVLLLIVSFLGLDVYFTWIGLTQTNLFREANPLVADLMAKTDVLSALLISKLPQCMLAAGVVLWLRKNRKHLTRTASFLLTIAVLSTTIAPITWMVVFGREMLRWATLG